MPKKYNYLGYLLNMSRKFGEDLPSSFLKPLVNVFQFLHANSHWKNKERNRERKLNRSKTIGISAMLTIGNFSKKEITGFSVLSSNESYYMPSRSPWHKIHDNYINHLVKKPPQPVIQPCISIASLKVIWRSIYAFQMTLKGNQTQPYRLPGWETSITYTTNLYTYC